MSKPLQLLAIAASLLLLAVLLNAGVLSASWRWDDPSILLHAHQFSIMQDVLDPAVWQQFSPANLTPLLILSMEIDLILAGMSPWFFYLHQLSLLAAAAFLLFVLLRLWCEFRFAVAGGVLFLCGLPTMMVAEQLMTRHYAEGLVLALLALYGFVRYLRTGALGILTLAVLAYVLAVMAKEVYVPLPAMLLCLPESSWQRRVRASAPFFGVLLFYAVWRSWMLPSVTGGYVDSTSYFSAAFLQQVVASYLSFPRLLSGGTWPLFMLLYLLLIGYYLRQKYRHSQQTSHSHVPSVWPLFSLLTAALVLLPLAPLVQSPGIVQADRYLFALWAALSFSMAFFAGRFADGRSRPWLLAGLGMLAVLSLVHALPARQAMADVGKAFDVQGEFVWQQNDSVAYQPSAEVLPALWFVTGLVELKRGINSGTSPVVVVDDIYLAQANGKALFAYDPQCICMRDQSADAEMRRQQLAASLRPLAPMSVQFDYQQSTVTWQFGPYTDGVYQLVSDRIGVIPAPPQGQMRAILAEGANFYVRYQSPEGWQSYSDAFLIKHNGPAINWVRE
ncbi:MAG: hypothetical protein Q7L07_12450 [Pseudohongiella sp.]|nr:hypothetical protein [Pseudohongiella sp.]